MRSGPPGSPASRSEKEASQAERHPTAGARHLTKQRYVYDVLRNAILRCELKPGERLVIDDLARRLETSIIPVREALRVLESECLVVNIAHVGATVAPISRASIVEVFTILEGLESVSTRVAADLVTAADLAALEQLVRDMDLALQSGQPGAWAELNTRFHLEISRLSQMPMLHQMLQRALDHWDRMRRYFFSTVLTRRAELAQREHHQLVQAITLREHERIEDLMRAHNRGALAAYTSYLDAAGPGDLP